jgi:hypothetical protein
MSAKSYIVSISVIFPIFQAGNLPVCLINHIFHLLQSAPPREIANFFVPAASHLYAFYYDVVCGGKYIWEVEKMHQQYGKTYIHSRSCSCSCPSNLQLGPIVRISPEEVHFNDPAFIDAIFAGPGHRREKGSLTINGLGHSPTAIATRSHDLHKSRRAALNPFFSTKNIRRLEPMVHEVLSHIFQHLETAKNEKKPVNMSLLYRAATHDLIADYAFGQGSIAFSREDLNEPYFRAYHEMVLTWHFGCYFPWFTHLMRKLPMKIITTMVPSVKQFILMIEVCLFPPFSFVQVLFLF